MANITTLAKIKTRCAIGVADTTQDDLINFLIAETTRRFEQYLGRALHRTTGCTDEFAGDARLLQLTTPPVEAVTGWELLDDQASGWVAVATAPLYQFRGKNTIIVLLETVGTQDQRLRVTYTGGYVFQDETPGAGQVPLPQWVEDAAITQVSHMWQLKDKINVSRVEITSGIQWSIADWTWVTYVRYALSQFKRNTYLGHS